MKARSDRAPHGELALGLLLSAAVLALVAHTVLGVF
jgi:hypothetical protein